MVPVAAVMFVVVGPGLAGADTAPIGTTVDVVHIEEVKGNLRFVAPATVDQGDQLEIVNETNPKKVGPHTFSLVTAGSVPKTRRALRSASRRNTSAKRSPTGTASKAKARRRSTRP